MLIGTAAYLAPEQVARRHRRRADRRVRGRDHAVRDAHRHPAAHRGHPAGRRVQARQRGRAGPSRFAGDATPSLDALVARATSRDPDLRPADAGQFLRAASEVRRRPAARPAAPAIPGTSLPVSADAMPGGARRPALPLMPGAAPASETQPPGPVPAHATGRDYPPPVWPDDLPAAPPERRPDPRSARIPATATWSRPGQAGQVGAAGHLAGHRTTASTGRPTTPWWRRYRGGGGLDPPQPWRLPGAWDPAAALAVQPQARSTSWPAWPRWCCSACWSGSRPRASTPPCPGWPG